MAGKGKVSLRKAINDKCRSCIHDEKSPGTWRAQVHHCPVTSCPLWPVRPKSLAERYQQEAGTEVKGVEKAIALQLQ